MTKDDNDTPGSYETDEIHKSNNKDNIRVTKDSDIIIPPGLKKIYYKFLSFLEISDKQPILITGETGTGKSFLFKIAQVYSNVNNIWSKSFTTVNCSFYSGDTAKSELFGYVKGSFTGALKDQEGILEKADRGILALDEIGDLPLNSQANMLTFIENGEFKRIGETKIRKSEVKIIAATNDPNKMRPDFRFRFIEFEIPPLHKRRSDILYYMARMDPIFIKNMKAWEALVFLAYNWPGNVRELEKLFLKFKANKLLFSKYLTQFQDTLTKTELSYDIFDSELPFMKEIDLFEKILNITSDFMTLEMDKNPKLGIKAKIANKLLNTYRLSINALDQLKFYSDDTDNDFINNFTIDHYGVKIYQPSDNIKFGLRLFCEMFGRDIDSNKNLLDIKCDNEFLDNFRMSKKALIFNVYNKSFKKDNRYINFLQFIFEYISGIKLKRNLDITREGLSKEYKHWFIES